MFVVCQLYAVITTSGITSTAGPGASLIARMAISALWARIKAKEVRKGKPYIYKEGGCMCECVRKREGGRDREGVYV